MIKTVAIQSLFLYIWQMNLKLKIGIFTAFLMFLGTYIEHHVGPNQQIILQFSNDQTSSDEAITTVEALKLQLQNFGVEKIQIGQYKQGQLKITYYSDADIELIKNVLSSSDNLILDHINHGPVDKKDTNPNERYKINISKIQNKPSTNWDFEGTEITELNHKSDRFYFPKVKFKASKESTELSRVYSNSRLNIISVFSATKSKLAYQIPEVRAGPASQGNS